MNNFILLKPTEKHHHNIVSVNLEPYPPIPTDIAVCPRCGKPLVIDDIDEWDSTGRVAETGLQLTCSSEPDIDDEAHGDFFELHFVKAYLDWVPVWKKVYRWFDEHYRVNNELLF